MNKVFFIGNLTRDPELNTTTSGISVCKFSIAVTRKFSNSEGEKETDFINIIAWRGLAETCSKYIKKGNKVAVVGSLQTRSYENKDGIKVNIFEIIADEVEFLSSKTSAGKETETQAEEVAVLQPVEDDTLPF